MGFTSFSGNQAVSGNLTVAGTINGVTMPVQDSWLPGDNILKAASSDLDSDLSNNSVMAAGALYLIKVMVRQALTASNVVVACEAAGSGASTGTFAGLYSSAGALLSGSSDVAADYTALTMCQLPLTTPQALAAGTFVWAALLVNLATTQPNLYRSGGVGTVGVSNGLLAASSLRFAVNGTGLVALPGSVTPASNTQTGAFPFWAGLS